MEICLRELKFKILENLNNVEKGCINQNMLETFLIELELKDENSQYHKEFSLNEKISYILKKIRLEAKFWIVNSEIYFRIMQNKFISIDNSKEENKSLEAIYNYITENDFYDSNLFYNDNELNNIYNINEDNDSVSEKICCDNNPLVEERYLPLNNTKKYYCDFQILKSIYNYFTYQKNYNEIQKIRIQDFIIFFILNNNLNKEDSSLKYDLYENSYSLRTKNEILTKLKEEEIEKKKKIIQEIYEKIQKIKKEELVFDFFIITKTPRLSFYECEELQNSLSPFQNSYSKKLFESLKHIHLILKVYISVRNTLHLLKKYLENYIELKQDSILYIKKYIIKTDEFLLSENQINQICEDYYYSIDCNQYHISKIKCSLKNWTPKIINIKLIEKVCDNYLINYYERDDIKQLRYYQSKNADWTEDEIKIFEKAQKIYGKEYLATNKIAKVMGVNKNHVRYKRFEYTRKFIKKNQSSVKNKLRKIQKKQWKPIN